LLKGKGVFVCGLRGNQFFFITYCTHSHIHTLAYNLQPVGQFETKKQKIMQSPHCFLCVSPTYAKKKNINLHKQKRQQIYTHLNARTHTYMHMALLGANRSESSNRHMQDSPTHTHRETQQRSAKTHTAAVFTAIVWFFLLLFVVLSEGDSWGR